MPVKAAPRTRESWPEMYGAVGLQVHTLLRGSSLSPAPLTQRSNHSKLKVTFKLKLFFCACSQLSEAEAAPAGEDVDPPRGYLQKGLCVRARQSGVSSSREEVF